MPDFVKQHLHFPCVHDGPAHGLSWEWCELTGAQVSELLKEKRKHKGAGRRLSPRRLVLGSSVPPPVSVQPAARQALTRLSRQGRGTLLMKCSVLVSTGPSWPLHHLLVSAGAFGEHNAMWLSFLAASVCFCNYFIALNSHLWDAKMTMHQTQSEEFKILRRKEMDPGRLDGL